MKEKLDRLKHIFTLFLVFLKVGTFTFGGGYAMIPLIEREIVDKRKYIEKKEVIEILAVAGTMPGSVAINIATFVGYKIEGFLGALVSIFGSVLPSFTIIYIISFFLRQFESLEVIKFAFNGIRIGVVALILKALISLYRQSPKGVLPYIIMGAAFIFVAFFGVNAIYVIIVSALVGLAAALLTMYASKKKGTHNDIS